MRGIYKVVNLKTNQVYIGKSENLEKRMHYHLTSLKGNWNKNKYLQQSFNEYGANNFKIEIVELLDNDKDLNEYEKYYIDQYQAYKPEFGFNRTYGGDGGNSYVDCMTEEEREVHWKKHKEIRSGNNNVNYNKTLYHFGVTQMYLEDDEIEEYERNGWIKGAADYFKQEASKRTSGEKNPFYGKHHPQEIMDKIAKSKRETLLKKGKCYRYYKGDKQVMIPQNEAKQYEADGWTRGIHPSVIAKMKETKRTHPVIRKWSEKMYMKHCVHYIYNEQEFIGMDALLEYLHNNGYLNISRKSIYSIIKKNKSKFYKELIGKLFIKGGN